MLSASRPLDEGERHAEAGVQSSERVAMLLDRGQIVSPRTSCPDATAPQLNRVGIGGERKRDGHAAVVS
jgi:hypothetical protein